MHIKTVYISGPMRHIDDWNYPAFKEAASMLKAQGLKVYNPADDERDPCKIPVEEFLMGDINLISSGKVDALVMLSGWEQSEGAVLEKKVAEACGLPVYDMDMEIITPRRRTYYPAGPHGNKVVEES